MLKAEPAYIVPCEPPLGDDVPLMPFKVQVKHAACAAQPLPYPSQEELWSDLLRRPWLYERSRGQRSSNPPDFKCVRTNAGLWRGSAPQWVRERWGEIDALNVGEKARQGAVRLVVVLWVCGQACKR